ncbi:hypothetical protein FQA47_011706 [Oryzias melastigma]|uniref:Uncharacterized protein n=1 Tax=Oryzias melastigma TaxID=30732 RepID=A0A834CIB8_ORYME|nr:hypothetical protein FQA47_011706 [Oryzias melastigma]
MWKISGLAETLALMVTRRRRREKKRAWHLRTGAELSRIHHNVILGPNCAEATAPTEHGAMNKNRLFGEDDDVRGAREEMQLQVHRETRPFLRVCERTQAQPATPLLRQEQVT